MIYNDLYDDLLRYAQTWKYWNEIFDSQLEIASYYISSEK